MVEQELPKLLTRVRFSSPAPIVLGRITLEIIKEALRATVTPTDNTTIYEYESQAKSISAGIAEIKGRYPKTGFVINQRIDELVYILAGQGELIMDSGSTAFAVGDVLIIERGEKYAWLGEMTLFMATTPKFDPSQHVEVE